MMGLVRRFRVLLFVVGFLMLYVILFVIALWIGAKVAK